MPTPPTAPRRVKSALDRMTALKMRSQGSWWPEIAAACGFTNPRSAYNAVREGLQDLPEVFNADEERSLMCMRLDAVIDALWPNRADPATASAITRAINQRALLLGLKQSVAKVQHSGEIDHQHRHSLDNAPTAEEAIAAANEIKQLMGEVAAKHADVHLQTRMRELEDERRARECDANLAIELARNIEP